MSLLSKGGCFQDAILEERLVLPDFNSTATFTRIFCLKALKKTFPFFKNYPVPGTLLQKHKSKLRHILSTATVVIGGLSSANIAYYHFFNWGKREASSEMVKQELGDLH